MERRPVLLKLEGLPLDTSHQDINRFFKDPTISKEDISILRNDNSKCVGVAYVRFHSRIEADSACRHSLRNIHGSRVTFKETSISEMVSTKGKIDGKASERRIKSPLGRGTRSSSSNSRLSREGEEARRLPFSKLASSTSGVPERIVTESMSHHRSRSRSPHHRHRRESFDERRVDRHSQFAESPTVQRTTHSHGISHLPHTRQHSSENKMLSRKRHVEDDDHGFAHLSSRRGSLGREWEREEFDVRHGEERSSHQRSAGSDERELLSRSSGYWKEEHRMELQKVVDHVGDDKERVDERHPSSEYKDASSSRGKRGPVPTTVAKMYELKVLGFPSSYLYKELRKVLGAQVAVAHNGIEFVRGSRRATAYVLVVGEASYHAALKRDGYQIDRHHTLTVLPANRAKETGTSKGQDNDLREVLEKKRHKDDVEAKPQPASPRGRSSKVSNDAVKPRREDKTEISAKPARHKHLEEPGYIDRLWNSMDTGTHTYSPPSRAQSNAGHRSPSPMLHHELPPLDAVYSTSELPSEMGMEPEPYSELMYSAEEEPYDSIGHPVSQHPHMISTDFNAPSESLSYNSHLTRAVANPQLSTHPYQQQQATPDFIPLSLGSKTYGQGSQGRRTNIPVQTEASPHAGISSVVQSLPAGILGAEDRHAMGVLGGRMASNMGQDFTKPISASIQGNVGGVGIRSPALRGSSFTSPRMATPLSNQVVSTGKLSSVVHIVNRPVSPSISVYKTAALAPSTASRVPSTIAASRLPSSIAASRLPSSIVSSRLSPNATTSAATPHMSVSGGESRGTHILRITGAPPSTTIQDVIGFLQDHSVSFNDVRIQCTDLGQPTGKVFVTYRNFAQAYDKIKKLSGTFFKKNQVMLDFV